MKRRRLILAAILVVIAFGAAWWCFDTGLSADERALAGSWRHTEPGPPPWTMRLTLAPDRTARISIRGEPVAGAQGSVWYVRGGRVYLDAESSRIRRAVRPIFEFFGPARGGVDEGVIGPGGELRFKSVVYTRAPAD